MKRSKNRIKSLMEHADLSYEQEMHDLADAIAEGVQQKIPFSDPFEDYVDVLRNKIHANPHVFRSRLTKGYNALLYALQEGENFPEKE